MILSQQIQQVYSVMRSSSRKAHINISDLMLNLNKENSNPNKSSKKAMFSRPDSPLTKHLKETNMIPMTVYQSPKLLTTKRSFKMDDILSEKRERINFLESLITSQKMFIDPSRWEQFMLKSRNDEKFQKALNAFLYSYFIQNYQ